jgi:uncharacterized protein YjbI with pentapeptide repeats
MKPKRLVMFLLASVIVITFTSIENVFAYSENVSTHHSTAITTGCFAAPSPRINWSNYKMSHTEIHFVDMTGANLSKMVTKNGLFYNVNLSGANLGNSDMTGGSFADAVLTGANLGGLDYSGADMSCYGHSYYRGQ